MDWWIEEAKLKELDLLNSEKEIIINPKGEEEMGYCCSDCGDENYTCTAWDGKGWPSKIVGGEKIPNHNLIIECPKDIKTCQYRHKKIKSTVKV